MNTQRQFAVYNAATDTVFAIVGAVDHELALDRFAREMGWPDYESMRAAGMFTGFDAYRLH